MFGLDEWIAQLGVGHPLVLAVVVAMLVGLRHATDPDHLVAVTTLAAGESNLGARQGARLGLAWGAGHATTLVILGLPIVVYASYLPEWAQQLSEAAVGALIVGLAVRLLVRRRRDLIHVHDHDHDGAPHRHLHGHTGAEPRRHSGRPLRTVRSAYGIGLVHGMGGSAGVGLLLLAGIHSRPLAISALLIFAACSALSMMLCSGTLGWLLQGRAFARRLPSLVPGLSVASMLFGLWYIAGALQLAPYPL